MQNDAGEVVDLYLPRKCSATNNLIAAKDHASVQISVAEVDEEGRMTGGYKTYAFCGKVRGMGGRNPVRSARRSLIFGKKVRT